MNHVDAKIVTLDECVEKQWDFVIAGSGIGGGAAAYALTKKGFRVLMLEKGCFNLLSGDVSKEQESPNERVKHGKWPYQIKSIIDGSESHTWPPLGCGVGGTSQLYAAALQRFEAVDFKQTCRDGKALLWPFGYSDIEPYYQQAEALFSVSGTKNPLSPDESYDLNDPQAMSEVDSCFFQMFREKGLNPYRLHVGIDYKDQCFECGGKVCLKDCKKNSYNSCIEPAMNTGNLWLATECEVSTVSANAKSAESLDVVQNGKLFKIHSKNIILSCGAYMSPVILRRSKNKSWPSGIGNDHDLVGRNLMFHVSDFIAIWSGSKKSKSGARKTIAIRDFYQHGDLKLGELQSSGLDADYGNILYSLIMKFEQSKFSKIKLFKQLLRIPAYLGSKLFGGATVFATILEDFPYKENRVVDCKEEKSGFFVEYSIHDELKHRLKYMREKVRHSVGVKRSMVLSSGVPLNFGHPCGTCRMGSDPSSSVLDEDCRVHGLNNLYVLDASFMPTSGGTNPSLTIAANALRVASKL
ncbi:GMC family oxidoreductase [Porticoccus sp. W117]|uniref:GMC oxidoreductase n=1 Tax=Porticoccus sp. W117 TaxID=3054777 RepID=UPI00259A573F|nr:GMC family oxidoreductase [Porticoccus sp. W117]MDM3870620.1 GMC family oxidoreductase [Porticoccus sp. W117]